MEIRHSAKAPAAVKKWTCKNIDCFLCNFFCCSLCGTTISGVHVVRFLRTPSLFFLLVNCILPTSVFISTVYLQTTYLIPLQIYLHKNVFPFFAFFFAVLFPVPSSNFSNIRSAARIFVWIHIALIIRMLSQSESYCNLDEAPMQNFMHCQNWRNSRCSFIFCTRFLSSSNLRRRRSSSIQRQNNNKNYNNINNNNNSQYKIKNEKIIKK